MLKYYIRYIDVGGIVAILVSIITALTRIGREVQLRDQMRSDINELKKDRDVFKEVNTRLVRVETQLNDIYLYMYPEMMERKYNDGKANGIKTTKNP